MKEHELAGDYYEMGRQYGAYLARSGFSPGSLSGEQLRFFRECEAAVADHAPGLLEEMRGVADGGGLDPDHVKALPLTLPDPGCSVVAVAGGHAAEGSEYCSNENTR